MRIKLSRYSSGWTADGDGDSAGVFIPAPASVDALLPSRGDDDTSPSHITFLYIGDVPAGSGPEIAEAVSKALSSLPARVTVTASEISSFTSPKGEEIMHLVPSFDADLVAARKAAIRELEDAGFAIRDMGKDEWKPHITLSYGESDELEEVETFLPIEWSFCEMEVWGTDETYRIPLGGTEKWSEDLSRVLVDGEAVHLPLDAMDVINDVRMSEGESPITGTRPVTEEVFDTLQGDPVNHGDAGVIAYSTYTTKERQRLLSKFPAEALHALLSRAFGDVWWENEPEVLLEDLHKSFGFMLDAGGINRLRALHAICAAPVGQCAFYDDPETFRFLVLCLSGRAFRVEHDLYPSPVEMSVAIQVVQPIRPGIFSDSVLGFVAAVSYSQGLWVLPGALQIAQAHTLRMCDNLDIPVDQDRVDRVRALVSAEREGGKGGVPDVLRGEDDVQAMLVIDVERLVDDALDGGSKIEQKVIDAWNEGAT